MIPTTQMNSFKAVGSIVDRWVALASCFAIPILVASSIVWTVDKAPEQSLTLNTPARTVTAADNPVSIGIPLVFQMDNRRAYYWVTLNNTQGDEVYVYPTHKVADLQGFDLQSLKVDVPASLSEGHYSVNVHLRYAFNPFKEGRSDIQVTSLYVKR